MSDEKKPEAPKPPPPPGPPAPPPPKNPGMVTFTVDGKEVVAKPGTNMIDAAKSVGVDIPYYCYHPRLTVAANCRMCMVESSAAPPGKLVPACQTGISEGAKITTNSDKVRSQQKMVMEFLLLNHPVDCSICDQAGECKLQDYYMRYDFKPSRLEGSKVLRNKRKKLNETVVLDQERCVLCTRCVRFMKEVAKKPQLGVFGRGSHEVVDISPEYGKLDSNYSGNIVDICPVGALLNTDFRFRARAWFLSAAPSVCTGCSRGCSIYADFMGQDTYRFRPRENEAINKSWICDGGRLSYKSLNKHRLLQSTLGKGNDAKETSKTDAVKGVVEKLKAFEGRMSFAASPVASNEDLMAGFAFARDVLKLKTVYVTGRAAGQADDFLITADKNPNRKGLEAIAKAFGLELKDFAALSKGIEGGEIKALYALGADFPDDGFAATAQKLELFIVAATNETKITEEAHAVLAASTHVEDEGSFTQQDGITQRFRRAYPPRGDSQPHWKWAVDLARGLGLEMKATSSREIFKQMAPGVPALASFEWDKKAPMNQVRAGISTMPAGADGRPPGWREQGAPNVRGLSLPQGS
ncbi:MAG: 2Fe-2S iron-sulfur cluster-binding protein [Myxococcaceae bacterium]